MANQPVEERADDGTGSKPRPGGTASQPSSGASGPGRKGLGGTPQGGGGGNAVAPQDSSEVALRYTPLWHAQHESRYFRRQLIQQYQAAHGCRLAVMIDQIDPDSATLFAELLHGTDSGLDLHLILRSRGGDGEVAVRLARMAQAACRRRTCPSGVGIPSSGNRLTA